LDAEDVAETWSELVDKKVQRKMHAKDIKRQDVIYGWFSILYFFFKSINWYRIIYSDLFLDIYRILVVFQTYMEQH